MQKSDVRARGKDDTEKDACGLFGSDFLRGELRTFVPVWKKLFKQNKIPCADSMSILPLTFYSSAA